MEILGVPPGPVVGEAWAHLKELRLDRGPLSPEEAEAELRALVGRPAGVVHARRGRRTTRRPGVRAMSRGWGPGGVVVEAAGREAYVAAVTA